MSSARRAGHLLALALAVAAAPFSLKELSGKAVKLSDFRGQVVLLDFWATWCDSCLKSLPVYERLYQARRGDGLVVLGIDEDSRAKGVGTFASKHGVTYPILLDADKDAYYAYRVRGLPTAFLIGRDGAVARQWTGLQPSDAAELQRAVDGLLQGNRSR